MIPGRSRTTKEIAALFPKNDAGGHGNRETAVSELVHCTVARNHAAGKYGGVANTVAASELDVRNCIIWGNTDDDGGTDDIDAQLFYTANTLMADDVDNNIIDHLGSSDTRFNVGGTEVNKGDDPVFVNDGTDQAWTAVAYDPDTGLTSFTVTISADPDVNDLFFQPDPASSPLQLLIKEINLNGIVCYGKWSGPTATGKIFDYHIDEISSGALCYGDAAYLTEAGDACDLDNDPFTNTLNKDLDLGTRNVNGPDSGAYEVQDG